MAKVYLRNTARGARGVRNEAGELAPYQPRFVVFRTDEGVRSPEGAGGVQIGSVEIA